MQQDYNVFRILNFVQADAPPSAPLTSKGGLHSALGTRHSPLAPKGGLYLALGTWHSALDPQPSAPLTPKGEHILALGTRPSPLAPQPLTPKGELHPAPGTWHSALDPQPSAPLALKGGLYLAPGTWHSTLRTWYFVLVILFLLPSTLLSQQLPDRSVFPEKSFIWNPAMTAPWDYWEGGIDYRQQWLGFKDAPRTAMIDIQYPFLDYNNSLGGFFMQDNVKPLKMSVFGLTYAYKVKFGRRRPPQLSIGAMATLTQHFLDALEVVVNDQGDEFIPSGEINKFTYNAGLGVFYTSYAKDDWDRDFFYFGLAANQLLPSKLVFDEFGGVTNLKRAIHANAIVGARFIKEDIFIEPSAWINYASVNVLDAHLSVKMEKQESFWAGLTYTTNHTIAIQAGLITTKGFAKDGSLRIGTMGSYNIGSFGQFRGLGYEAYVAYRFEL